MQPSGFSTTPNEIEARRRLAHELKTFCGLQESRDVYHCGQESCIYFDETIGQCALLSWDLPYRLGTEATRWFANHRGPKRTDASSDVDVLLAARCAAL